MDEIQAVIYGIFSGMEIIANNSDYIDADKVDIYARRILSELGHPLPGTQDVLDFNSFINEVNELCTNILLK